MESEVCSSRSDVESFLIVWIPLRALGCRWILPPEIPSMQSLVKTPNLTGYWRGYLTSSFDNHAKRHDLSLDIFQSWTQISIFLTTVTSISWSCVAFIQVSDPEGVALIYQYENQPLADATRTMHMHYGTAMLRMPNGGRLAGDYYAGRDRGTFGRICCRRV